MTDAQKPGATMPKGVDDKVIGSIDLAKEGPALKDHKLRLRRLVIQPGGVVPWHSHAERPAIIYIVSGTIVEYRSTCAVPIVHKAGEVAEEMHTTSHWWKNHAQAARRAAVGRHPARQGRRQARDVSERRRDSERRKRGGRGARPFLRARSPLAWRRAGARTFDLRSIQRPAPGTRSRVVSKTATASATAIPPTHALQPEPVEQLTEHGAADEAAAEIAREIDAAGRAAIRRCGAPDEGRRQAPARRRCQCPPAPARAARGGSREDSSNARPSTRALALHPAPDGPNAAPRRAGERRRQDRRQEHEIDETEMHRTDRQRRLAQHEVDVRKSADEGEQDAEADSERGPQRAVGEVRPPSRTSCDRGSGHRRAHRRRPVDRQCGERAAGEIESREHVEAGREPELVGDCRRHHAADEVASTLPVM